VVVYEPGLYISEEPSQFLDRYRRVSGNSPHRALGDVAAGMYRHRRAPSSKMATRTTRNMPFLVS
jgi:hypothetical protein